MPVRGTLFAVTHGMSRTNTYRIWVYIVRRCTNPSCTEWALYGGRGIRICERWLSFVNFFADMGERPSRAHTVERIDVNGDYEPRNCKWATWEEQHNNKRSNRKLTAFGETLTLAQWARRAGMAPASIHYRLKRGWSVERAVSEPKSQRGPT